MPVTALSFAASASVTGYFGEEDGPLTGDASITRLPPPYTQSDAAKALFLAAAGGTPSTQGFEAIANGTSAPHVQAFTGVNATFTTQDGSNLGTLQVQEVISPTENNLAGRHPISGTKFLNARARPIGWSYATIVTFDVGIKAFGGYGIDWSDFTSTASGVPEFQRWKVTFSDATTEEFNWPNLKSVAGAFPAAGSVCFAGIISTKTFTKIEMGYANGPPSDSSSDVFAWDEFYAIVTVTPPITAAREPTPLIDLDCGPSLGPISCPQSCPIPTPTWVPVVYSVVTSGLPTGLTLCGHSLGRQTC
jgi:hypothetical protein